MSLVLQTLNVTAPVFAMLFLGVVLRRLGWIDAVFINTASALVFKATMPTLLFISIIEADLSAALQPRVLIYFALATLATFLLAWGWAIKNIKKNDRKKTLATMEIKQA